LTGVAHETGKVNMNRDTCLVMVAAVTAMMTTVCGCSKAGDAEKTRGSEKAASSGEVRIGSQVWMAENLNVDTFRNGDPIPHARTDAEWERAGDAGKPAWCYYGNAPAQGGTYGRLYNWHAVTDPRGLAPEGWAIPSDGDWEDLIVFLGGSRAAGAKLKSRRGWDQNGDGTNESGFSGLPGGARTGLGDFRLIGKSACWWSSTDDGTGTFVWTRIVEHNRDGVSRGSTAMSAGFSVRCIRGSAGSP